MPGLPGPISVWKRCVRVQAHKIPRWEPLRVYVHQVPRDGLMVRERRYRDGCLSEWRHRSALPQLLQVGQAHSFPLSPGSLGAGRSRYPGGRPARIRSLHCVSSHAAPGFLTLKRHLGAVVAAIRKRLLGLANKVHGIWRITGADSAFSSGGGLLVIPALRGRLQGRRGHGKMGNL
jgi:hypothetical protein